MLSESDFDNELVSQKDTLIHMLDSGKLTEIESAFKIMVFIRPLWELAGYGYKFRELKVRALDNIEYEKNSYLNKEIRQQFDELQSEFQSF